MKKLFCIFISALMIFACAVSGSAGSSELADIGDGVVITNGDWAYVKAGNYGFELDEYLGSDSFVRLPYSFAKQYIISIGDYAFNSNTDLNTVELTSVLENIDQYAFYGCTSLEKVIICSSTSSIGVGVFYGDSSLTDVNLQDSSVTAVSAYCFAESGIGELELPDTCTEIGNYAFYNCSSLSKLTVPESVTSISSSAFTACPQLTIYCYSDSYAHSYAVDHELPFVLIDQIPEDSVFVKHSVSLNGDIGINFYVDVPDADVSAGKVKVDFAWTVDGIEMEHSVTLRAVDKSSFGYKATCPVAVAEMTYDVTATVSIDGVVQGASDTYSVQSYAKSVLRNDNDFRNKYITAENGAGRNGVQRYDDLITLIKAMLDYGSKAQTAFNRNTAQLANDGTDYFNDSEYPVTADMITPTEENMNIDLSSYGLRYKGSTIVYLSETSIRHYYYVDDWSKFNSVKNAVVFDGVPVTYTEKDGAIYFEKRGVGAPDLDTPYTLTIKDKSCKYSVKDYIRQCLLSERVSANTKALVKATYRYNAAANDFFIL